MFYHTNPLKADAPVFTNIVVAQFSGGDPGKGLDLQGNFKYAINVGGTAAECCARVRFRVTIEKNAKLKRPRVLTPEHVITVCYGEDVGEAMKQSVRDMVQYLADEKGMDPYDAYALLSLAGDVRISRTFRPISPVKMMLSRRVLDQIEAPRGK